MLGRGAWQVLFRKTGQGLQTWGDFAYRPIVLFKQSTLEEVIHPRKRAHAKIQKAIRKAAKNILFLVCGGRERGAHWAMR